MILYFSGTGNSRCIAQRIAGSSGGVLVSINDRIRSGDTSPIPVDGPLVIVTPTYAWRIPRVVRDWLLRTEFPSADRVWFVMSCGSEIGCADKYNRNLCRKKGLTCMGTAQIIMPENYIAMFHAPDADKAREIVAAAGPDIDRAAELITQGLPFPPTRGSLKDRAMSGPVNLFFYSFCVKDKPFTVSDNCTSCGLCTRLCPLNNIILKDGKPVWGGQCTHCMACICRCPAEAIEYGKKSVGQPRYHIEAFFPDK